MIMLVFIAGFIESATVFRGETQGSVDVGLCREQHDVC